MRRVFPSFSNPEKYGYAYVSGAMDHRAAIEARFQMFETGGHGLTQHSPQWPITIEQFSDYLWSLAAILPGDEELLQDASWLFQQGASEKDIAFAATIKYCENKTRHYNLRERTVRANPTIKVSEKEHWKQVPDWANGSPTAIYRIITPEYADGLHKFGIACSLYQWFQADTENRPWLPEPARFLDWFKGYEEAHILESGYYTCRRACEAYRLTENVKSALANHKDWLERKRTPAA